MRSGRCIGGDLDIGCSKDIKDVLDDLCSGREDCQVSVRSLVDLHPCQRDFVSYLEAGYECVKVTSFSSDKCSFKTTIDLTSTSSSSSSSSSSPSSSSGGHQGYLVIGDKAPVQHRTVHYHPIRFATAGSVDCPWILRVYRGQRINLTLVASASGRSMRSGGQGDDDDDDDGGGGGEAKESGKMLGNRRSGFVEVRVEGGQNVFRDSPVYHCRTILVIGEAASTSQASITSSSSSSSSSSPSSSSSSSTSTKRISLCHVVLTSSTSPTNQGLLYSSVGNEIWMHVTVQDGGVKRRNGYGLFVLKYQAVGCPDPVLPKSAHVVRSPTNPDSLIVACNHSHINYVISCHGNRWIGNVTKCPEDGSKQSGVASNKSKLEKSYSMNGVFVAILSGIVLGILIGLALLISMHLLRRRRSRQVIREKREKVESRRSSEVPPLNESRGRYLQSLHEVQNIQLNKDEDRLKGNEKMKMIASEKSAFDTPKIIPDQNYGCFHTSLVILPLNQDTSLECSTNLPEFTRNDLCPLGQETTCLQCGKPSKNQMTQSQRFQTQESPPFRLCSKHKNQFPQPFSACRHHVCGSQVWDSPHGDIYRTDNILPLDVAADVLNSNRVNILLHRAEGDADSDLCNRWKDIPVENNCHFNSSSYSRFSDIPKIMQPLSSDEFASSEVKSIERVQNHTVKENTSTNANFQPVLDHFSAQPLPLLIVESYGEVGALQNAEDKN